MSQHSPKPIKVLIVEDEYIVGFEITYTLSEMGYETLGPAPTGEEALALAQAKRPDVVLMDIVLKGNMDGIEAAQAIMRNQGTPVVFATASSERRTYDRAMALRPLGFFLKPLDFQAIDQLIKSSLDGAAKADRA